LQHRHYSFDCRDDGVVEVIAAEAGSPKFESQALVQVDELVWVQNRDGVLARAGGSFGWVSHRRPFPSLPFFAISTQCSDVPGVMPVLTEFANQQEPWCCTSSPARKVRSARHGPTCLGCGRTSSSAMRASSFFVCALNRF
jgi:hypothetical protein